MQPFLATSPEASSQEITNDNYLFTLPVPPGDSVGLKAGVLAPDDEIRNNQPKF
jgi:hypothetical protein